MLVDAWREGQVFREARTHTDGHTIWLHDHAIAWKTENDATRFEVEFTMAGYPTVTTREKLNGVLALLHTSIVQRSGTQVVVHQGGGYRSSGRVIHPRRRYRLTYASDPELGEDWLLLNLDKPETKPETKPTSEPADSWAAFR